MREDPLLSSELLRDLYVPESERGLARYICVALAVALGAVITAGLVTGLLEVNDLKLAVHFMHPKVLAGAPLLVTLCLGFLLAGLFLLLFTEAQTAGKIAVFLGTALLLVFSTPAFSQMLLEPLERKYPQLALPSDAKTNGAVKASRFIVVLADSTNDDILSRISGSPNQEGLACLVEGIRLYRQLGRRKLVIVGRRSSHPSAEHLAVVAEGLGVNPRHMLLDSESRDAQELANNIGEIVHTAPFILVAPASRMSQAMVLLTEMRMNPVAAPAAYISMRQSELGPSDLYPSSQELRKTERAIQEYLGLAWLKLVGPTF